MLETGTRNNPETFDCLSGERYASRPMQTSSWKVFCFELFELPGGGEVIYGAVPSSVPL